MLDTLRTALLDDSSAIQDTILSHDVFGPAVQPRQCVGGVGGYAGRWWVQQKRLLRPCNT